MAKTTDEVEDQHCGIQDDTVRPSENSEAWATVAASDGVSQPKVMPPTLTPWPAALAAGPGTSCRMEPAGLCEVSLSETTRT